MNEIKEYKTTWSKETPAYGELDDFVILESLKNRHKLFIRPKEFDFLMDKMLENYNSGISKYVQILSEWNECKGYEGAEEKPSKIMDIIDCIDAIKLIKGVDQKQTDKLLESDKIMILEFLNNYKSEGIKIRKE